MTHTEILHFDKPAAAQLTTPAVLTIAGSDNSGGAGIEADLKTFTSHGVYGLTCITALTAQNTLGVEAVVETPKAHIEAILNKNFDEFDGSGEAATVKVVKTGMLTSAAVDVLTDTLGYLAKKNISLVMDPVMIATSGKALVDGETMAKCLDKLIPAAYLCTPNIEEAQWLLGKDEKVTNLEQLKTFVLLLHRKLRCANLLVKGGHLPLNEGGRQVVYDVLYQGETDKLTVFSSPYIATGNRHGTGCTLASSISAFLARDYPLEAAVTLAIDYIHRTMLQEPLGVRQQCLNHTVVPSKNHTGVFRKQQWRLPEGTSSFFDYFVTRPLVVPSWARYTQHPFIKALATNQLPFEDFLYFLKQDYYYLMDYARVHGVAASKAPNGEQIEAHSTIIATIMRELARHREKLKADYGVNYDKPDLDAELLPGPACLAYCNFLEKMGAEQDFVGIKVAVAPCLHGYRDGGIFGKQIRDSYTGGLGVLKSQKESDIYLAWIEDYNSDWYAEADRAGKAVLERLLLHEDLSPQRMAELEEIFKKVVDLEVGFWDEVVDRK